MKRFHIVAAKKVKPCRCLNKCEAKYGDFKNEDEANKALELLLNPKPEKASESFEKGNNDDAPESPVSDFNGDTDDSPENDDKVEESAKEPALKGDEQPSVKADDETTPETDDLYEDVEKDFLNVDKLRTSISKVSESVVNESEDEVAVGEDVEAEDDSLEVMEFVESDFEDLYDHETEEDVDYEDSSSVSGIYDAEKEPDYYDDDRQILAGDDKALHITETSSLFKQSENIVSWSIENFYNEEGNRRNKYSLRQDPPIFKIESSSGDFAEFIVSREMSVALSDTFETIRKGYYGVQHKRRSGNTEQGNKLQETINWFTDNPVKTIVLLLMMVVALLIAFVI